MKKIFLFIAIISIANNMETFAQNSVQPVINTNTATAVTLSVDLFEAKINQSPDAQIIDTRLPEEYAINHLINAININAQQNDYEIEIGQLDKTKPVFTYAINAGRSTLLANELIAKGFTEVYILKGGIGGWIGNGKPIYSSVKDNFTIDDFNKIIAANKVVLLDLHTRYCPACRKLQPTIDSVATENSDVKIIKIDVYDNPKIAGNFKAPALPTVIVFKNGQNTWQQTGGDIQKTEIENALSVSPK